MNRQIRFSTRTLSAIFALLLATWAAAPLPCRAQPTPEPFAAWTFDVVEDPQYWYGTSFAVNFGNFPSAMLYADGTNGSSQFATVTTSNYAQMLKNDWLGTELGDPRDVPFDGYCLGFKHPNSAGRSFVIACPTTLYHSLSFRYAVTRSNTGFKKMTFAWSLTGAYSSYQTIATKPCDALDFEVEELNLENLTILEDQPIIYLRITIDSIGSTAYQGNIKFDNLCLLGTKCMDTLALFDTIISGENYYENGYFLQHVTGDGDYLYNRRVRFADRCDSLYQLNLHVIDTTTPITPPDTTDIGGDTTDINGDTNAILQWPMSQVKIFPNPATDIVSIDIPESALISNLVVYNSIGTKMYSTSAFPENPSMGDVYLPLTRRQMQMDISDWEPGIYFFHFTGWGGGTLKVVKL